MFLRNEEKEICTNSYTIVPYCKDCGSQNIKITYECQDCKSNNVGNPSYFDILEEKGIKKDYKKEIVHIYNCDKCKKEFETLSQPTRIISYVYGEFVPYEDNEYAEGSYKYNLDEDLCDDCLKEIIDKLNQKVEEICKKDYVNKVIEESISKSNS